METGSKRITDRSINCFLPLVGELELLLLLSLQKDFSWKDGEPPHTYLQNCQLLSAPLRNPPVRVRMCVCLAGLVARKLCGNIATSS